jgi:hypothetical protein
MKINALRAATLCALTFMPMPALQALAQTPPEAAGQTQAQGDPPGRVARLNYMAGAVTAEPAGASDWSYAQLNRPLTSGDQLWTDENARSELHIGSTAVRLGASTALSILTLDDTHAQLKVAQGTLSMRTREIAAGTQYEVDTPNTALAMTSPGEVRVDVAPDGRSTTVTVRSGGVTAYGDGGSVPLAPGQQVTFEGTHLQQAAANAAPAPDAFDQWAASRDAAEDRSISARYVSRDIPGYQDLDANGTWRNDPSYGAIWVPNAVSADWAPYRQGHWAWQAPWGWTWVDDAPWGFAPYHYGRWAYVGSQWAWVPGAQLASAPPAYAPALVGFVGDGGGGVDWNVALTVGGVAAAGVAWFALGPGEPWHPHHDGWSPRYYENVNRNVYVDRSVHINNTYVNYRAPRGLTALPASAFVRGQQAGRQPYAVDPSRWRNPHFMAGAPSIAPTRDSLAPGARRTDYRPPQGTGGRPVVATRAPVAPPAFHDRFARMHGGLAPSSPAMRPGFDNVHLVDAHGPRAMGGVSGAPHAPMQMATPHLAQGVPHAPQPMARPNLAQGMQPHDNGVPRPPQGAQPGESHNARFVQDAPARPAGNEPRVPQQALASPNTNAGARGNAPRIERGGPNTPMQAMQPPAPTHMPNVTRGAPQPAVQTAQPQTQFAPNARPHNAPQHAFAQPHAEAFHQARMEAPRQMAAQPQTRPQLQQPRQEMHQPQPQQTRSQQPQPQQPHPQQPQQAEQPHGGGNNEHHRG